jgi:hypothetical protein
VQAGLRVFADVKEAADVYPKGLRGFSTYLAHCSAGPRPQPALAPPLQSTSSPQAFNHSYAS